VPTPPKLRGGTGDIWVIEVLGEFESKHTTQADGHIGISGEIKKYLESIGQGAQPGHGRGAITLTNDAEAMICYDGHVIGDEDFLAEAHEKTADSLRKQFHGLHPILDL